MSDGTYCERCGDQMGYQCFGCAAGDESKALADLLRDHNEWKRRALAAEERLKPRRHEERFVCPNCNAVHTIKVEVDL